MGTEVVVGIVGSVISTVLGWFLKDCFRRIKQLEEDAKHFVTREENKELIKEKTDPLHEDLQELKVTTLSVNKQVIDIRELLARMDERMKRAE